MFHIEQAATNFPHNNSRCQISQPLIGVASDLELMLPLSNLSSKIFCFDQGQPLTNGSIISQSARGLQ
jgi:hypothetical protein